MGDYGFRVCTICGKDVLWEEAFFMKGEVVCCSEPCHDRHRCIEEEKRRVSQKT